MELFSVNDMPWNIVVATIRNFYKRNKEPVKELISAVVVSKYWIPLQTFVGICLVFKNICFTESFVMAASEFGYIWIEVG